MIHTLLIHINPLGEVADGASFTILQADEITGELTIATEGWNFDPATGSVVFGEVSACDPTTQGDLDGNGQVEFADFLILSANFGGEGGSHTVGDIDCNGSVEFADFLVLSSTFGSAVGAAPVPEPAGGVLLALASLGMLVTRRRR